jgi:hypothetical protein
MVGPIGGWLKRSANAVTGKARAILTWETDAASPVRWIMAGTEQGLFVQSAAGVVSNITPSAFVSGHADATENLGYGGGGFGSGGFGTPRSDETATPVWATAWDLDSYGQTPIGCAPIDGRIVSWDLNTSHLAAALSGAPTGCTGVVITPEGFVMALAPGGLPRRVQWSDQGSLTTWTPGSTNQAGDVDLVTRGQLVKGVRLAGSTLLLTDVDAHVATYDGLPAVYNFQRLGSAGCGAISKGCVVGMGALAAWWSKSGFWAYDGSLQPLECEVWEFLLGDLNWAQASKISGWHNARYGEAWWFYPSNAGIENDSYVMWAYRASQELGAPIWYTGSLQRLCGAQGDVFTYPLAIDASGYIYEHETGFQRDGRTPYIETGAIELGAGDRVMRISGLVADDGNLVGDVTAQIREQGFPDDNVTVLDALTIAAPGFVETRAASRQVSLRFSQAMADDWRIGATRLQVQAGGRR